MPFFDKYIFSKIKKRLFASLQVQKLILLKAHKEKRKRVYLFTSKGSLTLEGAIVTTIFMLVTLSVTGYLTMVDKQITTQIKINNTAVNMSKLKFYVQVAADISDYSDRVKKLKNQLVEDNEHIKETDEGDIDIIYSYRYRIPWIGKKIRITQRCLVKDWTGVDLTKEQEMVYITPNGKVYHITKECTHLSLNIRKTLWSQVSLERNSYGEKYSQCSLCVTNRLSENSKIFVTEDGTKYHASLTCSGLLRNIITVEKSKVKDMPECSRCSGK
jgi:hypothetical protein